MLHSINKENCRPISTSTSEEIKQTKGALGQSAPSRHGKQDLDTPPYLAITSSTYDNNNRSLRCGEF